MKCLFKNIGPIKDAELELGDLTVIAGANNTGKTYIAYALYGFREHVKNFSSFHMRETAGRYQKKFSDTENEGGVIKGSVPSEIFEQFIQDIIKIMGKSFSGGDVSNVFSAPREKFSQSSVSIKKEKIYLPEGFSVSGRIHKSEIKLLKKNGYIEYEVELNTTNNQVLRSPSRSSRSAYVLLARMVLMEIFKISSDFILPAERFGISLFYKELDFAKSRLVDALQKWSDMDKKHLSRTPVMLIRGSARYGIAVSDHIDWTRNLDHFTKQKSPLSQNKLFDNIKRMMDGYYRHDGNQISFISRARGKDRYEIPLHLVSSSARELSILYFYLKHGAHPNDLIIVDEPESHLDTKNQIQIARLLVQCINLGLRVLITTHSDYIVQELNNMIMLHSAPKNEKIRQLCKKQGYNEHHFLDKSKVKGYLCEKGGLEPCKIDDRGMNLQWVDQTIKDINQVSDILDSHLPEDEE